MVRKSQQTHPSAEAIKKKDTQRLTTRGNCNDIARRPSIRVFTVSLSKDDIIGCLRVGLDQDTNSGAIDDSLEENILGKTFENTSEMYVAAKTIIRPTLVIR